MGQGVGRTLSTANILLLSSFPLSLPRTVSSMQRQLGVIPLVTQLPLGEGRGLRGVVDLVQGCALLWERGGDGASYSQMSLEQLPEDVRAVAWHGREELVEQVRALGPPVLCCSSPPSAGGYPGRHTCCLCTGGVI